MKNGSGFLGLKIIFQRQAIVLILSDECRLRSLKGWIRQMEVECQPEALTIGPEALKVRPDVLKIRPDDLKVRSDVLIVRLEASNEPNLGND